MKNTLKLPPETRAILKETGAFFSDFPEPVPDFVTKEDATLLDLPVRYIQHDGLGMPNGTLRLYWKGDTDESELKLAVHKTVVPPSKTLQWEGEFNLFDANCAALLAKHADQFRYSLGRDNYVQTSAYVMETGGSLTMLSEHKFAGGPIWFHRPNSRSLSVLQRSSFGGKIVRYKKRALEKAS